MPSPSLVRKGIRARRLRNLHREKSQRRGLFGDLKTSNEVCPQKKRLFKDLCGQDAGTTSLLDLLLRLLGEKLSLHSNGLLGQLALAEALEDAELSQVDEGSSAISLLGVLLALLEANHRPELVHVDGGHVVRVLLVVEITHTHLTEITRVILVESNSVHVLTTSVTATGRMLTVLANATVTAVHATALLPVLLRGSRLHNRTHFGHALQTCSEICTGRIEYSAADLLLLHPQASSFHVTYTGPSCPTSRAKKTLCSECHGVCCCCCALMLRASKKQHQYRSKKAHTAAARVLGVQSSSSHTYYPPSSPHPSSTARQIAFKYSSAK